MTTSTIRCISLWQPWATAIAVGLKKIETRDWTTSARGRVAIHAAKRWTRDQEDFLMWRLERGDPLPSAALMPRGAIVAVATIVAVRPTDELDPVISERERDYGNYQPGRFGWLLEDVTELGVAIPWKGSQGFFAVPRDIIPGLVSL